MNLSPAPTARTSRTVRAVARAFARATAPCLFALVVLGCDDESNPIEPPPILELVPGTWHMHEANGVALPAAEIARRFIGVVDEETVVDSSRIEVGGDGTWEQRYWTRVFHIGVLDRSEVVFDRGAWSGDDGENVFTSHLRTRTFRLMVLNETDVASDEPMVFFTNAVNVTGVYRQVPPTP